MPHVFLACDHYADVPDFEGGKVECPWGCGKQARQEMPRSTDGFVSKGDMPEHMNRSFGQPVRGRRHFRELQRTFDTVDYEPRTNEQREMLKHGLAKSRRDSGR